MPESTRSGRLERHVKLRDLQILATAAECGSMAKAAVRLAMTQPAVSEAIAGLEAALRVRLLDRGARGVAPTVYGQVLLRRGQNVFDELNGALREIQYLADPTSGEVRIAAGDTMAASLVPAVIDRISSTHPGVVVHVAQPSADRMDFRELRERKVDLALARVPSSFAEDDLETELLFSDPHRVVVGARSPWVRRRTSLRDLVREPWLFAANQVIRDLVVEAFRIQGLEAPRESVVGSSILMRNHLLATGRFVTVLPESVIRYNGRRWGLKALPIDLGVAPRAAAVVKLRGRSLAPAAELFVRQVRDVSQSMLRGARRAGVAAAV